MSVRNHQDRSTAFSSVRFFEKKRSKENATLFTKFSCFCKWHLPCLFRKITFKSKVSFLCLWHLFFPIQWKNPHQFYGVFPLFCLIGFFIFALWKAAQELLVNWQSIQFYKAHFISSLTNSKSFLGKGEIYFYSQSGWLCLS